MKVVEAVCTHTHDCGIRNILLSLLFPTTSYLVHLLHISINSQLNSHDCFQFPFDLWFALSFFTTFIYNICFMYLDSFWKWGVVTQVCQGSAFFRISLFIYAGLIIASLPPLAVPHLQRNMLTTEGSCLLSNQNLWTRQPYSTAMHLHKLVCGASDRVHRRGCA